LLGEQVGRQRHVFHGHATLFQILAGLLHQAANLQLDQRLRQLDGGRIQQRLHYRFLVAGGQATLDFTLHVLADFGAHFFHVTVGDTQLLGQFFVHFRQLCLGNALQGDVEDCGLTGNVLAMVVLGEVHGHADGFAFLQAFHAILEVSQHLALTDHEREVFGRTAFENHAVDASLEVDDHAIAFGGRTLNVVEAGTLLAQDVDGLVDLGIGHWRVRLFDLLAGQIAHHDFRINLEGSGELEAFGVASGVNRLKTRVAGYAQLLLDGGLVETLLHLLAQHFFANLRAIVHFNDLGRGFAWTETLNLGCACHALQALGNLCVDCRHWQGNAHATLKAAQRFQLYLHVQSLDLKVWEIKARDKKQDGGTFYKNRLNLLFAPIQRYCRRRISQGAALLARILATKARDEYSMQPPNEQCIALARHSLAGSAKLRSRETKNRRNLCCAWV